jgi:hypothetical protein
MNRLTEAFKILFLGEETYTSDPAMPQSTLLIVPVESSQRPEQISPEVRDSVLSLRFHPGFQYLTQKFRFQKQVLAAKLQTEQHSTLAAAQLLQSMIGALSWHEQQIAHELSMVKPQPVSPTLSEQKLFEQIQASLELI